MKGDYKIVDHTYDVVIVGAGGAGLRATMGMAEQGNEGRKKTGLVNLGRLAASPDCPDEQKVAAIEQLATFIVEPR